MSALVQQPEEAVDAVLARFQRKNMPGLSVGVLSQGKVVLRKGYGLADIAAGRPNAADVPMRIASLSKQFLVSIVLMLEAEGRLAVSDPIQQYLPELPDYGVPVTLLDLMSNQSGVRDFLELRLLSGGNFSDPATAEESYRLICSTAELNFLPGSRFAYSNSGFLLLTRVLEKLEGEALETVLQRRILQPLGMTQTRLARTDSPWIEGRAVPYVVEAGQPTQGQWSVPLDGAGGMLSTVDDLLKWAAWVRDSQGASQSIFQRMAQARPYADGSPSIYGLGFTVMPYRGQPSFGHHGQLPGVFAEIAWFPQADMTLVLIANTTEINPFLLGRQLADVLIPSVLAARLPAADVLPGYYYNEAENRLLQIEKRSGEVMLNSTMTRAPLEWHQPGCCRPFWPMLHYQFSPQPDCLLGSNGPNPACWRRLTPWLPEADASLAGVFYQPELNCEWRISRQQQQWQLELAGPFGASRFTLLPLADGVMLATPAVNPDGDYRPTLRLTHTATGRRLEIATDRTSRLFADEIHR